ncbi:MAG: rRNA methyltransferase [Treponema sp.]|jgi:hypothetical protein|nr:rRNA methyltransferase [Treponema sp.]
MTRLFPPLAKETRRALDTLQGLIEKTFPLPARFRRALPAETAALSRLLRTGAEERRRDYLSRPGNLSAYLRYFLPWNVYRLCRLLPALPLDLPDDAAVTELGAGPLSFAIALFIARPELRSRRLDFRCVDLSGPALEAGKALFSALSGAFAGPGGAPPWRIKTIRCGLWDEVRGSRAALTVSVNVWNECFPPAREPERGFLAPFAAKAARRLDTLCAEGGRILAVEPGIPRAGEFIALLRESLLALGRPPLAPCTHREPCAMPGGAPENAPWGKSKWCHFAFDTEGAPPALEALSMAAGLPKERGVLSFLLTGAGAAPRPDSLRVQSDAFALPEGLQGRYACGKDGLVLLRGSPRRVSRLHPGTLVRGAPSAAHDAKTGALVVSDWEDG